MIGLTQPAHRRGLTVLLLMIGPAACAVLQASPQIRDISLQPTDQVERYQKLEITFAVDSVAEFPQFPFDVNTPSGIQASTGISVDAEFTPDNWKTVYSIPAFYYQEFQDDTRSDRDWIYPTGRYFWKVRFAPHVEGQWQYRLIARDREGVDVSSSGDFVATASQRHGFIRTSQRDSRYFEYSDGTYFPGLGYNLNYDKVSWRNPTLDNRDNFERMHASGIQLVRIWLSQWSIFGSEWNPWMAQDPALHSQYLPFTGITFEDSFPGSEVSMKLDTTQSACMFTGVWKASPAVKRDTYYRVRIRYKLNGVTGPRVAGAPYGLVAKTGWWLWGDGQYCMDPGTGNVVTRYAHSGDGEWQVLEGTWYSSQADFMPYFFLVLENATAGSAYIDYVWIEEDLGGGQYGPNIVSKPWMAHHLYFDQRNSFAFDKVLELADENNVALRLVLHEKNDRLLSAFDYQGVAGDPDVNWFYGNWDQMTKTRWLLQAFWRYAQARWGYSTSIHSWELLNEGDPYNSRHYRLASSLGQYMHCGVFLGSTQDASETSCPAETPNAHMTSTSFWNSFPRDEFWANSDYPFIDFADIHEYIPDTRTDEFGDTALATEALSTAIGAKQPGGAGKPVIRGETGFVSSATGSASPDILKDVDGVWLHNFIWGGINPGGLIESYWYPDVHIYDPAQTFDHREEYAIYYHFIRDVPLSNGQYVDLAAEVSNASLRVWGQKDVTAGRAHMWVQNMGHTWQQVVSGMAMTPQSGLITIRGLQPSSDYLATWWDTYQADPERQVLGTRRITSSAEGVLTLDVVDLVTDIAVKIEQAASVE